MKIIYSIDVTRGLVNEIKTDKEIFVISGSME